jgi:alpha-amylase
MVVHICYTTINLIQCHQKLDFKGGSYKVRSAEVGLFTVAGSTADHLVIERSGKAVIGINDNWDTVQELYIDTDFPQGTVLMDYSGANGLASYTVPADQRIQIITQGVNPALNGGGKAWLLCLGTCIWKFGVCVLIGDVCPPR